MFQVQETIGGADFVHLAVDAGCDNSGFTGKAKIFQVVDTLLGRFVMTDERSTFDSVVDLGCMETERAHVAGFEYGFSIDLDAECVGGIVDDFEPVNICDFLDALCVARGTVYVDGHNRSCLRCNGRFDFFWIDVARFFFDIHKYGFESVPPNGVRCCNKTIRRRDNFTCNAHGLQCRDEGQGAVCKQAEVFYSQVFG